MCMWIERNLWPHFFAIAYCAIILCQNLSDQEFRYCFWKDPANGVGTFSEGCRNLRSADCAGLNTRILHNSLLQSVTGVWNFSKKNKKFEMPLGPNNPKGEHFSQHIIFCEFGPMIKTSPPPPKKKRHTELTPPPPKKKKKTSCRINRWRSSSCLLLCVFSMP